MEAIEAQRGAVTCPRSHSSNRVKIATPGFSDSRVQGPPQVPRESSRPMLSSPAVSGLRLFVLPARQPCPHPSLPCLNPGYQPPCLCLWHNPTPRKARPGPGAALSRHFSKLRRDGGSGGPGLAGPTNNGPSVPSAGPASTGCPPAPSPAPAPHTSAVPPRTPCPPWEQASSPWGRAWESHVARPGNRFCRIPRAVLPGWEPGGLGGRNQAGGLPRAVTLQSPPPP